MRKNAMVPYSFSSLALELLLVLSEPQSFISHSEMSPLKVGAFKQSSAS